ncbi:uroporphyrinogen-III C-methyltransferase [Chitinimonas koreensis]|uniref:uroporphyrinogen-III C-methyltransferase n=1 Tax=Chitinimonas koreensis TaxID=356302 RepID=UPI000425D017|nr:uroporphyrinogen-III C-methyltransferase [Chitinimonas koreensis]QNM97764.1 uroporphyrinogen-III C-methyltransferase [Chitinimonas koreensis]
MSTQVYLIGAGPGDPELLTLKAVRAIGACDVLLVDDLVNRAVLAHARPDARIVAVGKRGGCRSTPQDFITRLMLRHARQGRVVGRLKGGDPFVFGRGGEEVEALRAAGIRHEVVNGITAGLAAATAAGIPLTHRDACRGVTFVTGHTQDGGEPDWAALAGLDTTLVVYMGMRHLDGMAAGLIAAGLAAATPAAVIERATLPDERRLATTLGRLPQAARAAAMGSPAIVVIGQVAALADAGTALPERCAA